MRVQGEKLQEELIYIQSKVTKYEWEISAHKMKVDEQKYDMIIICLGKKK